MKLDNVQKAFLSLVALVLIVAACTFCSSIVLYEFHLGDCVETQYGRAVIVSGIMPDPAGDWAMITYGGSDPKGGITAGGCLLKDMKKIPYGLVPDSVHKKADYWIKTVYPDMLKKGIY